MSAAAGFVTMFAKEAGSQCVKCISTRAQQTADFYHSASAEHNHHRNRMSSLDRSVDKLKQGWQTSVLRRLDDSLLRRILLWSDVCVCVRRLSSQNLTSRPSDLQTFQAVLHVGAPPANCLVNRP